MPLSDKVSQMLQAFREQNAAAIEAERAKREAAIPCDVCGRPLTDPESIARGIGPECANKSWGELGEPDEEAGEDGEHQREQSDRNTSDVHHGDSEDV